MNIMEHISRINPKLFIEIGAHFGIETTKFRKLLPECTIICFEPDPRNINVLKEMGINRFCILEEMAVSKENGDTDFYLSSGDCKFWSTDEILTRHDWSASSSLKRPKKHLNHHRWIKFDKKVKVPTIRLDDYEPIKNKVIDFIWMDVQGAEDLVIEGAKTTLERTRYIYTEYNNDEMYEGQMNLEQICQKLGDSWKVVEKYSDDVLLKNVKYEF
jgi:FkbM family methyltransferase